MAWRWKAPAKLEAISNPDWNFDCVPDNELRTGN
jgi:hypothetical protein